MTRAQLTGYRGSGSVGPLRGGTIKDVAEKAGVSFTTVSHVLNNTRRVSDDARSRVERAVAELGYLPSAVARALKTSATQVVGVLVPNIVNPFFAELTRGVEDQCRRTQYAVYLCNCDNDERRLAHHLQSLLARRVDGLVLAAEPGAFDASRIPSVVIDRARPGCPADAVRVDNRLGARLAVEHLLGLGHRRIACLAGPDEFELCHARVDGWRDALAAAGVTPAPAWLMSGPLDAAGGYALGRRLLAQRAATAVFASNDLQAIGLLRAAAELGVAVPRELSVVGFDGIELGAYFYPALTTVGYSVRHLGERAAALLQERIADPARAVREVVLPPRLTARESTAPPQAA